MTDQQKQQPSAREKALEVALSETAAALGQIIALWEAGADGARIRGVASAAAERIRWALAGGATRKPDEEQAP